MDGQAIVSEMDKQMKQLDKATSVITQRGIEMAEAEKAYRIVYAQELLKAKADDKIPMSIIESVVKGKENVADAKMLWSIAETKYQNVLEYIMAVKTKIKVLEGEIARGWQRSKSDG